MFLVDYDMYDGYKGHDVVSEKMLLTIIICSNELSITLKSQTYGTHE